MHKTISGVTVKSAEKGEVSAVFSTFNVVDKDGDVTLPDAIKDGTEVVISAYGHQSHFGKLPVGKGVIRTTGTEAILNGTFFLGTEAGRETFEVVKELGPLGEWSYSLDNVKSHRGEFDGQEANFLESIFVKEVSPVLLGAGVNTRTLATKGALMQGGLSPQDALAIIVPPGFADDDDRDAARKALARTEYKGAIRPHQTSTANEDWSAAAVKVDGAGVGGLRAMHAWVDTTGDPEASGNYRFLHHGEPGGPANLRACLAGIAKLNGAQGAATVPDADKQGVFNHLASHLIDAGRQVPELRSAGGETKFFDELIGHLDGLSELVASAERVVALRASHGKELSRVNAEVLEWIHGDMVKLRRLLDTPEEDFARELLRSERLRFQQLTH